MRFEKYHSVPKTRLAGDPAHRCSTPQNWLKCSYCAGIRHKCVPVPEFYQESARSLAIDAAALVADINRRRSDIRSLKSRAKVWRKRIENRMNKKANQEGLATTTVMIKEEIRLRTLKELMRIGDLLAVVAGVAVQEDLADVDMEESDFAPGSEGEGGNMKAAVRVT